MKLNRGNELGIDTHDGKEIINMKRVLSRGMVERNFVLYVVVVFPPEKKRRPLMGKYAEQIKVDHRCRIY